jgi:hypothetical protein
MQSADRLISAFGNAIAALRGALPRKDEKYEPKMKGTHVVFKTVELLQQFYGAEAVPAHKVERITLEEWPESVTIAYYAPRGRRHLQLVTLWQGRTKVNVFARQLRDDKAREQLPLEMRARLMTRKARSTKKQEHQVAYAA